MDKYYNLLGLHLKDVEKFFEEKNIKFSTQIIQGKKDQDKLTIPKVIKITQVEDGVQALITYFSDSLK